MAAPAWGSPEWRAGLETRVSQAVGDAIAKHHAAGRATCHGKPDGGPYLLFPDKSERFYPQGVFPDYQPGATDSHFSRWVEFMQGLYALLDPSEWAQVSLDFGPHVEGRWLTVEISPEGLTPEHRQAAVELVKTIAERPAPPKTPEEDDFEPF